MDSLSLRAPTVPENITNTPDLSRLYARPGFLLRRHTRFPPPFLRTNAVPSA